jgi:hypothetical protein
VQQYTQRADGGSIVTTTDLAGNLVAPLAADPLPFDYRLELYSTAPLRGRDMNPAGPVICASFRSDYVLNSAATPYTSARLIKNVSGGSDTYLETHRFANDGNRHDNCWPGHDRNATYHFNWSIPNPYRITAHGTVYNG